MKDSAVAWSWVLNFLRLGSGVIILPLLLSRLSEPDLGMFYVFSRLIALTQILDFGFSFALGRNVSYAMGGAKEIRALGLHDEAGSGVPNHALLWQLVHAARRQYLILSLGLLALLGTWGTWTVGQTVQQTSNPGFTWLAWSVAVLAASLELYMGWWNNFLRGYNNVVTATQCGVIGLSVMLVVAAVLLLSGGGLLSLPVGSLVGGALSRHLSKRACLKLLDPDAAPARIEVWPLLARLWPNSWRTGLQIFSVYLGVTIPGLHFASVHGLDAFAPYGLAIQLMTISIGMSSVWTQVKWPLVGKLRVMRDHGALRNLLWPKYWMQMLSFVGMAAFVMLACPPLLEWIGTDKTLLARDALAMLGLIFLLEMQFSFWTVLLSTENRIPSLWPTVASQCAALVLYAGLSRAGVTSHWTLILPPLIIGSCFNYWYWCFAGARSIGTSFPRFLVRSFPK